MKYAIKTGSNNNGEILYFQHFGSGCIQPVEIGATEPQIWESLEETKIQLKVANILTAMFEDDGRIEFGYEIVEVEDD
ncbi:hypothetical protein [Weissella minor]|uniref:hypothetical protein n=1 Tax=Weissella minor TaxID=1620 RepID=UPI00070B463C|nr:hypothetical protein [Weissella minor]